MRICSILCALSRIVIYIHKFTNERNSLLILMYIYRESPPISPNVSAADVSLPESPQSTYIFQPPTSITPTPTHGDSDPIVDRSNLKLARSGLIFKQDALGRSVDEASRIRENKKNLNLALRRGQVVDHSK